MSRNRPWAHAAVDHGADPFEIDPVDSGRLPRRRHKRYGATVSAETTI